MGLPVVAKVTEQVFFPGTSKQSMDPERTAPHPRKKPEERADPSTAPSTGDKWGTYFLGPYRVVDEIGVGGMATVELARMDGAGGFQKWVAIKRVHPHLTEDVQFINMFLDEARIAASISHPNVAQVFDLGKDADTYWIAMEYLHGEPLREIMRASEEAGKHIRPELAAKIIADAAEGLHAAHELRDKSGALLNLVHRDVSPHNLFVTYDGVVKVVDFGIAKVAGRLSSTHAGTLKGKVAYMSPEQVKGKSMDRRTDIFALGVVLWELTMRRRLFRVDSDLATLSRVEACVVPPPSSMDEDYPPELESVVLRALERDPADRFQTAREFSRALQQYLMQGTAVVGPEEVSTYVTGLFADRVRTREDHLRWAAEVTQTISIKEALTSPEATDDLLDLAKLPRVSAELDAVDFDTIRDQPAPAGRKDLPSPLGDVGTGSTTGRLPQSGQEEPLAKTQPSKSLAQRQARVEVTDSSTGTNPQKSARRDKPIDDIDEDSIETLIASSPTVLNSLMADVRAIAERSMREEKEEKQGELDSDGEPDSLVRTTAFVRTGEGPSVQFERASKPVKTVPKVGVSAEPAWPTEDAAQPDQAERLGWRAHQQPGYPVFESGASRAAETIQIRAARRSPSLLVMAAAALGAGFVAAGLSALMWARDRAPTAPSATATASVTAPVLGTSAAAPPPTVRVVAPEDVGTADAESLDAVVGTATGTASPRRVPGPLVAQPPPTASEEGSILDSLPDFPPPDPPEAPPKGASGSDDEVAPGYLTISCRPACEQIIAGSSTFGGAASRAPMPPGQYRVRLKRGDIEKVISVIVVSGENTSQSVSMDK